MAPAEGGHGSFPIRHLLPKSRGLNFGSLTRTLLGIKNALNAYLLNEWVEIESTGTLRLHPPPTPRWVPSDKPLTNMKMTDQLSPSKVGTGSSVFRPALAGGAAQESVQRQIKSNEEGDKAWVRYTLGQRYSWWRCLEWWDAGSTKLLRRPRRPKRPPSRGLWAPTSLGGWISFARILWQEGQQQSAAPTGASATAYRALRAIQDMAMGWKKWTARGTERASDLIKALAGGARWREPGDATWSRVSSGAGLPTATTEVTLTQSVAL